MPPQTFGLLELGSNSLKHYRVQPVAGAGHRIETSKIPWRIAHDFFKRGELRESAVEEILAALRRVEEESRDLPMAQMLCVATGVFREFENIEALAARVKEHCNLRLRVISGNDEARLMGKSLPHLGSGSVVVADLGGATTEWVRVRDGRLRQWGSLPLGAIRNHCMIDHLSPTTPAYLERSRQLCAPRAAEFKKVGPARLLVTGGTAKALARIRGEAVTTFEALQATLLDVESYGLPPMLESSRREVYVPGLVVLEQLMLALEAPELEVADASVREGMARRLVALLGSRRSEDLHSTLLLDGQSFDPQIGE